tara:strand:- start:750 stop:1322 length:573 start_codon:yes stop_codon:yes gene_type:complete
MASLLEKLSKESPSNLKKRSIESMNWFRSNARLIKTTPQAWQRNIDEFRDKFELGKMYMFFYDAKHKKTLPYWDRFPVMIPVERYETGVLGINLHYISPRDRVKLMDGLFDLINEKEFTDSTRFRLTYDLLKSVTKVRMAKPCIKQYLWGHVDSRITEIRPDYWDIVAMLPVQKFNVNANRVYNESRKQY